MSSAAVVIGALRVKLENSNYMYITEQKYSGLTKTVLLMAIFYCTKELEIWSEMHFKMA